MENNYFNEFEFDIKDFSNEELDKVLGGSNGPDEQTTMEPSTGTAGWLVCCNG